MKNIIIASTSTIHGSNYLDYLLEDLALFFNDISNILFLPYARPSGITHDDYTSKVSEVFSKINKDITGIHSFKNTHEAVRNAEAIFVGGGNTFVLVNQLYKNNLLAIIKQSVENGTPYLGTSAGSNICGLTMHTTNDMPIIQPPSFKTLGLVPFNINPHYLDSDTNSTHKGETRETRIKEFHAFNSQPVVGLREGSWLRVHGSSITLKGKLQARIFENNKMPYEINTNSQLQDLK
jgi:dipeptidase E